MKIYPPDMSNLGNMRPDQTITRYVQDPPYRITEAREVGRCAVWDSLIVYSGLKTGMDKIKNQDSGPVIRFFDDLEEDYTNVQDPGKFPFDGGMHIDSFDIQLTMMTQSGISSDHMDQFFTSAMFFYEIPEREAASPAFPLASMQQIYAQTEELKRSFVLRFDVSVPPQNPRPLNWSKYNHLFPQITLRGSREDQSKLLNQVLSIPWFEITIIAIGRNYI